MKKFVMMMCALVMAAAGTQLANAQSAAPAAAPAAAAAPSYSFGDFKSSTLATKGWQALADKNVEAVVVYTNKCIELYAAEAAKMQATRVR